MAVHLASLIYLLGLPMTAYLHVGAGIFGAGRLESPAHTGTVAE